MHQMYYGGMRLLFLINQWLVGATVVNGAPNSAAYKIDDYYVFMLPIDIVLNMEIILCSSLNDSTVTHAYSSHFNNNYYLDRIGVIGSVDYFWFSVFIVC